MPKVTELAQKAVDAASEGTAPSVEDIYAQIATLRADMAALGSTIAALGKSKGHAVADAAREDVAALRAKGEEQAAMLAEQARGLVDDAEGFLRNRPAAALGIAVGAGVLVGLILNRR